ncbi:protein of unknown function [Magnetospirillum sp. XM-1]|uniref:hypothetical protein n=1 Tax=Magnetospirillum sp. XM-1 TaxID=1663591 RepID=UPI00073DCDEE|nr:hypothetical protein [Magnetospirillum sp. XM-1]CUW39889.1 protein of unknown function [Magnetospirillum sp. XM-1]
MKYTIGRNKEQNYPSVIEDDWAGFVSSLQDMSQADIQGANKDECKDQAYGLTACTFTGDGRRLKANATETEFVWLDCEVGKPNELAKAIDGLRTIGLEAVVYSSAGHAPPADRFRIILPLASPISSHTDYRRVCLQLQASLGVAIDRSKLTMYALLYQPARYSSATKNVFVHLPGTILTAEDWISVCPPAPAKPAMPTVPLTISNIPSGYVEAAVKGEISRIASAVSGQRHNTILSAAIRLAELSKADVLDWSVAAAIIMEHGVASVGHGSRQEVEDIVRYAWATAQPRQLKEQISNISAIRMKAGAKRKELAHV